MVCKRILQTGRENFGYKFLIFVCILNVLKLNTCIYTIVRTVRQGPQWPHKI